MDPVSHGLVGAATAQVVCPSHQKEAAIAGFLTALLPDLDVLVQRADDPLFQLEFHRQFSHCLAFTPVGALLASLLLWWPLRNRISFKRLYIACFAAYATAGLLDACTSYGTQLLWPFSDARIAWNLTPVVEPAITLGLIILIALSLLRKRVLFAGLGLLWLSLTLLHGGYRKAQAHKAASDLWESRGHQVERYVVKPTLGNQLLWRVTYIHGGQVSTDAVRTRLFGAPRVYEGESAPLLALEDFESDPKVRRAMDRFSRLSGGYLIYHPTKPNVVGDARYSMLPDTLTPLWGLEIQSDKSVEFRTFRRTDKEFRRRFWEMLR